MSSVSARACDVFLNETDITNLRKLIVVRAIASASIKEYVHLEKIADIDKGKTGIKDALPGPFPLVVTAEARSTCDHFDFEGPAILIPMVSSTGHGDASLKRIHYQEGQYAVGTILAVLRIQNESEFSARFVYQYLSAFKDELLVSRMVGTANVSLTLNKLRGVSIPVLPIAKQREVEKLMQACDRLEARQADAESAHAQLVEALLGSLTQARDANEFATHWQRLSQHFHTLFTTESTIDALKQTVLQLAVMGKLVPQDPDDEPASTLLTRIGQEMARILVKGKGRKQLTIAEMSEEKAPTKIASGWVWVKLGDIALIERGGSPRPIKSFMTDEPDGLNWIKIGDTDKGGKYVTAARERIRRDGLSKTRMVYPGDFLLTNSMSFGRPYITQIEGCIHDGWLRISPPTLLNKDYLYFLLSSAYVSNFFKNAAAGAVVMNLNADKVRELPISIPPAAEQHRIVAKVDQLMALCDQLKSCLTQARQLNEQLANTLVEQAVA